jgi:hypothetical protein
LKKVKQLAMGLVSMHNAHKGLAGFGKISANSANQAGLGLFPNEFALTMLPG